MQTIFTFSSPGSYEETVSMIKAAVANIGGKTKDEYTGHLNCNWRGDKALLGYWYEFFIGGSPTVVRVIAPLPADDMMGVITKLHVETSVDKLWGRFMRSLLSLYPDVDFGLTVGMPEIDSILYYGGDVEQVYVTNSKHHPSYTKAVIGGALFGEMGAVVGAMGGRSRMETTSFGRAARSVYIKMRLTNGRLKEGTVQTKSRIYQEIMTRVQAV